MATTLSGGNRRLLERAKAQGVKTLIESSNFASSGRLNAEQADRFIDYLVDQSRLMKDGIRVVRMTADRADVDKLSIGTRILRAATEGTDTVTPAGVTTAKKQLAVTEMIMGADISFTTLEDQIERGTFADHVLGMFGTQLSNDLEDLAINGDGSTGSFLSIEKGWIQLFKDDVTTNIYDTDGSEDFRGTVFEGMLRAMPNQFKANRDALRFYCSVADSEKYRFQLSNRQTGLGDGAVVSEVVPPYSGVKVVGIPYMPDATILLTVPDNLVFGIRRDVSMGTFHQERKRVWEYTWTVRADYQIAHGPAAVLGYNAA